MSDTDRLTSMEERFWRKVDKSGGAEACWLWTGAVCGSGYGRFYVKKGEGMAGAHRVAYELTHGAIQDGLCVCHHCDNKRCVNPAHLFVGTRSDNMIDMIQKVGHPMSRRPELEQGSRNPQSKLTEEQVLQIRAEYARGGRLQRDIGAQFGVNNKTVSKIVTRYSWRHI